MAGPGPAIHAFAGRVTLAIGRRCARAGAARFRAQVVDGRPKAGHNGTALEDHPV